MRAEAPAGRGRSFEEGASRTRWARRCIVGSGSPSSEARWRAGVRRSVGPFADCYRRCCTPSRPGEAGGHICRARRWVGDGLLADLATVGASTMGGVGWRRIGIGRESRRPCGYVSLRQFLLGLRVRDQRTHLLRLDVGWKRVGVVTFVIGHDFA